MKKLYIAILFHQHQPYYKDPVENYYHFPWVRFHAIKDYYDIAAMVENFQSLKLNINLVPSLIIQLEDYAFNNAMDKDLELTIKNADKLTEEDKVYILKNFFRCNWQTMVYPYPRYNELLEKRGKFVSDEDILRKSKLLSKQEFLDLQVWYNLAWFDPIWRKEDLNLANLYSKQQGFSEEDKQYIVKKQREICSKIIPLHKKLQEEGKIEISLTPFFHPILPLIIDTNKAKISNPHIVLPQTHFSHPEDAKWHLEMAVKCYQKHFETLPKGMWPAEGSVSEDIIPLVSELGIKWIATDEDILKNSLLNDKSEEIQKLTKHYDLRSLIYQNYEVEHTTTGKKVNIIFRDRELADSIGFIYSRWPAKDAVKDIETKLTHIYKKVYEEQKITSDALVSIILDGENCWEYYPNDGIYFLTELYTMLTTNPLFETVLISEFLEKHPPKHTLKTLWPGSWINANYNIWIGHKEDNLAWEYLTKTRNFLTEYINQHPELEKEKIDSCWQEIYIAEGSDWCWWYGEEHYTPDNIEFDYLFRKHLKNVYRILNEPEPPYLNVPIKGITTKKVEYTLPNGFINPEIDGKITNYFEWLFAGKFENKISSALHQSPNIITSIFFGFDTENLYFRIDYHQKYNQEDISDIIFNIEIKNLSQKEKLYIIQFPFLQPQKYKLLFADGTHQEINCIAKDKIIELKLPFNLINSYPNSTIQFSISANKIINDKIYQLEQWPENGYIELKHPDENFLKNLWNV